MGKKFMCEQKVALDMLASQPKRGGLSKGAFILHQKQCEDTEKLFNRMQKVEGEIVQLRKDVDQVKADVSEIKDTVSSMAEQMTILVEAKKRKEERWEFYSKILSSKIFHAIVGTIIAGILGAQYLEPILQFFK